MATAKLRRYTGVGSRRTPTAVLEQMHTLGRMLALGGYTLRSGAADGADSAFEAGAREVPEAKLEIYLPWRGFNGHTSRLHTVEARALTLAASLHPAWPHLSHGARRLHARDVYQVIGFNLDAPSVFLVCWTCDGCESAQDRTRATGGTATAIVLAEQHGVPVFNLAREGRYDTLIRSAGLDDD